MHMHNTSVHRKESKKKMQRKREKTRTHVDGYQIGLRRTGKNKVYEKKYEKVLVIF